MTTLPHYVDRTLVSERLQAVFPEGTPNRNNCVRETAASVIFTGLYIGAVEGSDRYLGPVHVYRMTDEQAAKTDDSERLGYVMAIRKRVKVAGTRWYADGSREPIRDESLRDGLVSIGAVVRRQDLATTAGLPIYSLKAEFAALFDPMLTGDALTRAIASFQATHLSKSALSRIAIIRAGAASSSAGVRITFPNGETRQLAPGASSRISRAVIEEFTTRFLQQPAVLWLSESGNKVVVRDESIAAAIGLKIDASKDLPDLILADLGPKDPLIVFVEVVATDGAITARRQEAIYAITDAAGFQRSQVTVLSAYQDRQTAGFKKTVAQLAWDTFAWFVSEPDHIVVLRSGGQQPVLLASLLVK